MGRFLFRHAGIKAARQRAAWEESLNLKSDPEPDRNVIAGKVTGISNMLYVTH
ncbi:MAG: hypothetical protein LBD80_05020 [Tannerella sp.]|nr:hypothetical protein [Tannerella sp.]